jgi:hypothetical protein
MNEWWRAQKHWPLPVWIVLGILIVLLLLALYGYWSGAWEVPDAT